MGKLQHGIYRADEEVTDFAGVDPSILQHYYGVTPQHHRRSANLGAGHSSNEEADEDSSSEGCISLFNLSCIVCLTTSPHLRWQLR